MSFAPPSLVKWQRVLDQAKRETWRCLRGANARRKYIRRRYARPPSGAGSRAPSRLGFYWARRRNQSLRLLRCGGHPPGVLLFQLGESGLVVEWAYVAECRVEAGPVVKALYIIKDCDPSLSASEEAPALDHLFLYSAPKSLHGTVVIAIARLAHRGDHSVDG